MLSQTEGLSPKNSPEGLYEENFQVWKRNISGEESNAFINELDLHWGMHKLACYEELPKEEETNAKVAFMQCLS